MCDKCAVPHPLPTTGSRRRRLWDLPHNCHCPVVGVCLPLDTLRTMVNKALGGRALAEDYEVHVGVVAECTRRNRLSELLQGELEKRYALKVQACRSLKTSKAVADMWAQAVHQGDVAGAFWAALTHPRCDDVLQEVLLRDLHMVQHQAGAAVRIDVARFKLLQQQNGVLAQELAKAQERCARLVAEKAVEMARLEAEAEKLRASNLSKDTHIADLTQAFETLKASLLDFDREARLQKKVSVLTERQADLEAANADLKLKLGHALKSREAAQPEPHVPNPSPAPDRSISAGAPVTLYLRHKTVLCVGGRNGSVANYRDVVEKVGGRFVHHDGGVQDNQSVLDAGLAAADLVVCQTGCISHNAYWRVKDFCKRMGKRCVFVESPSVSSLVRGLEQVAEHLAAQPVR